MPTGKLHWPVMFFFRRSSPSARKEVRTWAVDEALVKDADPPDPKPASPPAQPTPPSRPEAVPPRPGALPEQPMAPPPSPPQSPPPETPGPPLWATER